MSLNIPSKILSLPGQRVKHVQHDLTQNTMTISCTRDRRHRITDPSNDQRASINRYVRRTVRDVPICGYDCHVEIELAQIVTATGKRRIESCDFVDKGVRFTHRFCHLISGLCRHMSIQVVALHLGLRWETVKNIDVAYLKKTLPALDPSLISNLKYIGVDEVARAKGHDYMTVIYDMERGHLIGVETGRTAQVFSAFLKRLSPKTAENIEAVAMDMGPAYQKSVRDNLPNADIVFDRFHVMKNYSDAIKNQRRIEFRKADREGKQLMKGSHYLLLKNSDKLTDTQENKLITLLENNSQLNTLYVLKEQLQTLWDASSFDDMTLRLETWCAIAEASNMLYLKKFAASLRRHQVGICNYATYRLTSARIEAGNVSIGMIRKRARGIRDTEYFKLKIRQTSIPDQPSMFRLAA